ncbi:MAG: undecaprenyl-diphosphate phosphatase [Actinomycetota bacterium]|nr:undecaprenyl-diphosphate phosphatase [Actinomycetota bacterium]
MKIIQSIILGLIQGATEFLPISSSGHLVIFPYLFRWESPPLYFIVTVHFATLASVVTVFYREIYRIIKAVILGIFIKNKRKSNNFKLGIFLIIASIPAAIAGFFLDDYFEGLFTKPLAAAGFLLVTALFLWLGELRGKKVEKKMAGDAPGTKKTMDGDYSGITAGNRIIKGDIGNGKIGFNSLIAIMTGIGQALAIFPGVSRSGATISFARFYGIKRVEAVRFSFLLSVPIIFGSFVFELYRSSDIIFNGGIQVGQNLAAGFIAAYSAGLLAVKFIIFLTRKRNLNIFAIYCVCLALAVAGFYLISKII